VRIEEQAQLRAPFSELLLKLRPTNSFTHSVFSSFIAVTTGRSAHAQSTRQSRSFTGSGVFVQWFNAVIHEKARTSSPGCALAALRGRRVLLRGRVRGYRLVNENIEDTLTDLAVVKVLPLPVFELNRAAGRQKQPAILNMSGHSDIHRRYLPECKSNTKPSLLFFNTIDLVVPEDAVPADHSVAQPLPLYHPKM